MNKTLKIRIIIVLIPKNPILNPLILIKYPTHRRLLLLGYLTFIKLGLSALINVPFGRNPSMV